MKVEVNISGDEYPECPLRNDLNGCSVVNGCSINSCPKLNENGKYTVPAWCPLLSGNVIVQSKFKINT